MSIEKKVFCVYSVAFLELLNRSRIIVTVLRHLSGQERRKVRRKKKNCIKSGKIYRAREEIYSEDHVCDITEQEEILQDTDNIKIILSFLLSALANPPLRILHVPLI